MINFLNQLGNHSIEHHAPPEGTHHEQADQRIS